jgi:hypothetical protein
MFFIFAAVRGAAQGGGPARQQRYGPFGWTACLLFIIGTAVAYPWFRVLLIVLGAIAVLSALGGLVWGLAHQNREAAPRTARDEAVLAHLRHGSEGRAEQMSTRRTWPMPSRFNELAEYNGECHRGIAHIAEHATRMAQLQREFDAWNRRRLIAEGWKELPSGAWVREGVAP